MQQKSNNVELLFSETSWPHSESTVKAKLVLEDGEEFYGFSFGYEGCISGEVVFNTGMVGYPESLTDPSYRGQLLVLTYPLVGNYGVADDEKDEYGLSKHFEGETVHAAGLIVADYSFHPSHYTSRRTLGDWLKSCHVPAIMGVDTRAITKHIRSMGSMLGKIIVGEVCNFYDLEKKLKWDDPNKRNLVAEVSNSEIRLYTNSKEINNKNSEEGENGASNGQLTKKIILVDCGTKTNSIRHLLHNVPHTFTLMVVPYDYPFADEEFDGLFISNGPGNPESCRVTIDNIRKVMARPKPIPILGVCLGHQLMAIAAGASTYKMRFGNRGMNQPVIDLRTTKCYITPQNHGYAVDSETLPKDWMELFVNANDRSNEGIVHRHNPWVGVQFHPEACGGPTDTEFLFNPFLESVLNPTISSVSLLPMAFPTLHTKVLLLGSGGLSIGQAGEFDYSGSQAIKALKEANVSVVLINPNIATVQTSNGLADKVYFLPVTADFVEQVIEKERPDGLLCTFGGQTALNCAIELHKRKVLQHYNCNILGTSIEAIIETEDREIFAAKMESIGETCAKCICAGSADEAVKAAEVIGFPVLVRTGFALGGLGSGFATDVTSLLNLCSETFSKGGQVMIDQSLKGWKELEYEIIRDWKDNCIAVCNMENLDPLGIHTGDSIVVAPSQTLSNNEYFKLRETALKVVRHLGILGECNIQFAVDPHSSRYCIVEVNARLSRSSALASKATGYPLAYVSAKLALGYDLVQLRNAITRATTSCCEPSLDYVVTKVPRWDLKKFNNVNVHMGSAMKSVGEVMAIGRTFEESLQKALRMVEDSSLGFCGSLYPHEEELESELQNPSPLRIWAIAKAFELNYDVKRLHELTQIDYWFLWKLKNIDMIKRIMQTYTLTQLDGDALKHIKKYGFSDIQIGKHLKEACTADTVRAYRIKMGVIPYIKQIDTLAAEFEAQTNYLYLTYQACQHDVDPLTFFKKSYGSSNRSKELTNNNLKLHLESKDGAESRRFNAAERSSTNGSPFLSSYSPNFSSHFPNLYFSLTKTHGNDDSRSPAQPNSVFMVLGCGCYRVGSSVEFDWSAMSCVRTLRDLGYKAIMVNCNPETVSTDYDESDRLFFEELSLESILDIWEFESPKGIIVSVGGQAANNLAYALGNAGVCIMGSSVESIDMCEDRKKFSKLCDALRIDQPEWSTFTSLEAAKEFCYKVKFPVLVRPSYVLSGAAMKVVSDALQLQTFLKTAAIISREYPVVITKYIKEAKEVEMDSVAMNGTILNFAISEHIENAGVHSGDATLILPAHKLYVETIRQVKRVSQKLAKALMISGPFNIQFLCKRNEIKIIECNLRASRTFPFISKTYNVNFIEQATRVMVNAPVRTANIHLVDLDYVGVKSPMFSFSRLRGSDPVLGVEMRSTGEVACFGKDKHEALLKSLIATGFKLPKSKALLSIGPLTAKVEALPSVVTLLQMGFELYATLGTHSFLAQQGDVTPYLDKLYLANKSKTGSIPNCVELIESDAVELVVAISESLNPVATSEGFLIRRAAVDRGVALITDLNLFLTLVEALHKKQKTELSGREFWEIKSSDEYTRTFKASS